MPELTVYTRDGMRKISFLRGVSVSAVLKDAGVPIRSGCCGNGACGLCLIRVEAGEIHPPARYESLALSAEQLNDNIRLACQLLPENDLRISLVNEVSTSEWGMLPPTHLTPSLPTPVAVHASPAEGRYGLAVDLGTTHISLSIWDLQQRRRVTGRVGLNPQLAYGSDVVTRLTAACESQQTAQTMARLTIEALRNAVMEIETSDGFSPEQISHFFVVGNTAMLALLTQTDPGILLQPRSWTMPITCRKEDCHDWASILGLQQSAFIEVIDPLAGFVGSDLLAGVLASRLTDRPGGLLIDFGTNSEIALWDGGRLWVTSAAGGPAFEGCGIQCGMQAEPGAIFQVDQEPDASELHVKVLGGGAAKGICGSGIVDLIAFLRRTGNLTATGKFTLPHPEQGFIVQHSDPVIRLTHRDVDLFQRAKGAIGAGIQTLLSRARMSVAELNRICVCGAFGAHLTARHAQEIGLLPEAAPASVELCGNTALAGCESLLSSPNHSMDLAELRRQAVIINLSQLADFETLYLENLYLQPQRISAT
jgi:uncharacterized 2Fe-2S/4Fe-4S cluster protein (DUF4445 family)